MARHYQQTDPSAKNAAGRKRTWFFGCTLALAILVILALPVARGLPAFLILAMMTIPAAVLGRAAAKTGSFRYIERERKKESRRRGGRPVLGQPPNRSCLAEAVTDAQSRGKAMIDKYLVGFELETGAPLWVDDDAICSHGCVFAKTGVGKTLWLESLMLQQMARGRASGCTFIDAKRDSGTLAHIIVMAIATGRIEDLIVIDPFDPVHSYNFVLTDQRPDVKARKVLRAGLPPTSDQSVTKHYDRLAADSVYRMVRALESFGLPWSLRDVAVALSAFELTYPHLRAMLERIGARKALIELGHLATSYRTGNGQLDGARMSDNLRGIASELHAISGSEMGAIFCAPQTDLVLTDAVLSGKIIYFMVPRLEEAESAARMVRLFREDLEVTIGEITSSRDHALEDPHLVIVDEGASTFGPTWANLFELARKGRFALLFGAQSAGAMSDATMGLSPAFFERVMANVNMKVMMRVGDNHTAKEMAEWVGKVATTRKSVGAGVSSGRSIAALKGTLDLNARAMGSESESISFSEDEDDLVSAEELKHEMSAEKGLAWFDLGDGRIVKGRSLWFDADLPRDWSGREWLLRSEKMNHPELGLADWVDREILLREAASNNERQTGGEKILPADASPAARAPSSSPVTKRPFRLSDRPDNYRGRRGNVTRIRSVD